MPLPLLGPLFASLASALSSIPPALAGTAATNAVAANTFQSLLRAGMRNAAGNVVAGGVANAGRGKVVEGTVVRASSERVASPSPQAMIPTSQPQGPRPNQMIPTSQPQYAPPAIVHQPPPGPTQAPPTQRPSGAATWFSGLLNSLGKQASNAAMPAGQVNHAFADTVETAGRSIHELAVETANATNPMVEVGKRFQRFGDELLEGQRHLTQYNDRMAHTFSKLDIARENMQIERANRTSGSAIFLAERQIALERSLAPHLAKLENISNVVAGSLLELVRLGVESMAIVSKVATDSLGPMAPAVIAAAKKYAAQADKKNEIEDPSVVSMLKELADPKFYGTGRMRPPLDDQFFFNKGKGRES